MHIYQPHGPTARGKDRSKSVTLGRVMRVSLVLL